MGETPCGRACVVRKLGLPSQGAYLRAERPADIPRNPERIYANKGWQGWNDWLGLAAPRVPRLPWRARPGSWKPFEEARTFARSLKLPSTAAWRVFVRSDACPPDIPAQLPPDIAGTPDRVYAGGGWQGWSDWLGTPVIANFNREFLPFEEARAFVRKLGLRTAADGETTRDLNSARVTSLRHPTILTRKKVGSTGAIGSELDERGSLHWTALGSPPPAMKKRRSRNLAF